jgi:hypothetical protein
MTPLRDSLRQKAAICSFSTIRVTSAIRRRTGGSSCGGRQTEVRRGRSRKSSMMSQAETCSIRPWSTITTPDAYAVRRSGGVFRAGRIAVGPPLITIPSHENFDTFLVESTDHGDSWQETRPITDRLDGELVVPICGNAQATQGAIACFLLQERSASSEVPASIAC